MSLIDPRWDDLTDDQWAQFAMAWIAELNGSEAMPPLPNLPWLFDDPPKLASEYVVPMNFTASPGAQWNFIVAAYRHGNEPSHSHLAAGPLEHFLSKHGDRYIALVEELADVDPAFAQMLKGCYQHQMSAQVWRRLCIARGEISDP
jgi:hypothetical protein